VCARLTSWQRLRADLDGAVETALGRSRAELRRHKAGHHNLGENWPFFLG